MIANRYNPLGVKPKPTAKAYVQEGLIAIWDALENLDWGKRDAKAKSWRDLISGTEMAGSSGVLWGSNYYLGQTGQYFYQGLSNRTDLSDAYASGMFTIEATLMVDPNEYPSMKYPFFIGVDISSLRLYCKATERKFGGWFFSDGFAYDVVMGNNTSNTLTYRLDIGSSRADVYVNKTYRTNWNATSAKGTIAGKTLYIGRNSYAGGDNTYFQGGIHCIRWYNRPLTTEEIAHNYAIDKERFGL